MPVKPLKSPKKLPRPLFDTMQHLQQQMQTWQKTQDPEVFKLWLKMVLKLPKLSSYAITDYQHVTIFLFGFRGSLDTFNSYRRELERLIQWSWLVRHTSILKLKNTDLERFIEFCLKPPKRWIALKIVARFIKIKGGRQPNSEWRPFVVKISKKAYSPGDTPDKKDFTLSPASVKILFNVLNSFYNYLLQEELITSNPIARIRQRNRYLRKEQHTPMIRRLSTLQWEMVIKTAHELAEQDPAVHERTLFIMNILYGMYLRISELVASARWTPKMCDFFRDGDGNWWFKLLAKVIRPDLLL